MKPKEYVEKHKLSIVEARFDQRVFVKDFQVDFEALIGLHQRVAWNFTKFQVCVKDMRLKFDSIVRRSEQPQINEKLWSYFYASVVGPLKDEMFPEMQKRPKRERESKAMRDSKAVIAVSIAEDDVMERRRKEGLRKEREARTAAVA